MLDFVRRGLFYAYFFCFTILFEEKIVGGLWYKIKGACVEEENLGDGKYYLQRVFIDPSFQSRGIAQKAVDEFQA